jgi:hypothetical protein
MSFDEISPNQENNKIGSVKSDQEGLFCIGECPSNSPFLKDNGAEAHCF